MTYRMDQAALKLRGLSARLAAAEARTQRAARGGAGRGGAAGGAGEGGDAREAARTGEEEEGGELARVAAAVRALVWQWSERQHAALAQAGARVAARARGADARIATAAARVRSARTQLAAGAGAGGAGGAEAAAEAARLAALNKELSRKLGVALEAKIQNKALHGENAGLVEEAAALRRRVRALEQEQRGVKARAAEAERLREQLLQRCPPPPPPPSPY